MIRLEKRDAADIATVRDISLRDDQVMACFKVDAAYADGYGFCTVGGTGLCTFLIDA